MSGGRHTENGPTGAGQLEVDALAELVERLVATMQRGAIARLDVRYGELSVSLRGGGMTTKPVSGNERQPDAAAWELDDVVDDAGAELHTVRSPMIGTYYASPAPNEPPFVVPGDVVESGQTIAIVEAMKIMNEIAADRGGEIVELMAANGQTVEYGSPLVRLRPDA